jgi:hypothetical protein
MQSWERNVEAYHIVADMLVNLRRIMHRGLEKCAGKSWYLDACPPGIYENLISRKEREAAIDRFSRDYEQIINFATFSELADILEFNNDLKVLLASLEPEGATLVDRLREMEIIRVKMAEARVFGDDDIEVLGEYHREFRELLTNPRKKRDEETVPAAKESAADFETEAGHKPASLRDGVAAAAAAGAEFTNPAIQALAEEDAEIETEPPVAEAPETVATDEETAAEDEEQLPDKPEAAPPGEEIDELDSPLPQPARAPTTGGGQGPRSDAAIEAELAMANDDDTGVLRALRREVLWIAEGVFNLEADRPHEVWETLRAGGWYDMKLGELALAPLEFFYSVAEEVRDRVDAGVDPEEIRQFIAEAHFSTLLLSLREMFLKQGL